MKKIILLLLILAAGQAFAQEADSLTIAQAKKDLTELYAAFKIKSDSLKIEKDTLANMAARLDKDIQAQLDKTRKMNAELDVIYKKQTVFKAYYQSKGVKANDLDSYFPSQGNYAELDTTQIKDDEKAVYVLYGNNKIASEEEVFKDEKIKEIFKDIFNVNSETCLGTFEIPGCMQKIRLYKEEHDRKVLNNMKFIETESYVYFDNVKFSVREGRVYDIRVRVVNKEKTQQYYFENKVPISLLDYPRGARWAHLYNSHNTSEDVTQITSDSLNGLVLRMSDALSYFSNPGNNFVPDDVEYTFPTDKEKVDCDKRRRVYKINQDTNLQNVMELRTYTDFLGLFDDSANGIVQVEGKADIYVAPFQTSRLRPYSYLNKISPYVHFTRLDQNHKGLTLKLNEEVNDNDDDNIQVVKPLEIIEKSYLDMGLTLDVMDFTFKKQYPFCINTYFSMRYQIATLFKKDMLALLPPAADPVTDEENKETFNFKSIGTGIGLRMEFRRFNNFGFFYSPEMIYYNHLNRIEGFDNPSNMWIFRNEAEIFYYPGESKKQSIFIRLRTFMNTSDGEDSFFQLQFGYRFAVGLGSVKGKPQ